MADVSRNWFLTTVGAPRAWQIVFGGTLVDLKAPKGPLVDGVDWGGIQVAHIDHGYTRHPATRGIVRPELGVNYMEPGREPRDPMDYDESLGVRGHCARTGGVLAGIDRAAGYLGAAPGVPLIPYRVTNRSVMNIPGGTFDEPEAGHVGKAIRHALHNNRCPVISISLGALLGWRTMGEAVDEAYEAGVIIVAAAGQMVDRVVYPGKYPQAIRVGGIRPRYRPYCTYSGAFQPDIWAPGDRVWRPQAAPPDDDSRLYDYDWGDGTSYSTAMVAALAALFLRHRGAEIDRRGYRGWQRVELFRSLLPRGARSVARVKDGLAVQFPGVLTALPDSWPRPTALRRATPAAIDMFH